MTDTTAITKFLESPRDYASQLKVTKDFEMGVLLINAIHEVNNKFDSLLSTVIQAMEEEWKPSEHEGEKFYDFLVRKTKLSPTTIFNHTKVGEMLPKVPDKWRPQIAEKDSKTKNRIAETILEGYELTDDQWEAIADSNYQGASVVMQEVTQKPPRSQWMMFAYEDGIIYVNTNEGWFEWARINSDPRVKDVVDKASKRAFKRLDATPRMRY